jgi:hypothetical protein
LRVVPGTTSIAVVLSLNIGMPFSRTIHNRFSVTNRTNTSAVPVSGAVSALASKQML